MKKPDEVGSIPLDEGGEGNSVALSIGHQKFLVGLPGVDGGRYGFLLTNLILLLHRVAPAGDTTRKTISKGLWGHSSHDLKDLGIHHGEAGMERQCSHGARGTAVTPLGIVEFPIFLPAEPARQGGRRPPSRRGRRSPDGLDLRWRALTPSEHPKRWLMHRSNA